MKLVLLLLMFAVLNVHNVYCAMSEAQMKAAMKLMRNTCIPKFKASPEEIDALHDGKWEVERSTKCYLWCLLNMYRLITKENVFDWEAGIATINAQAPESIKKYAVPVVTNCKDAVKTNTDKCEAAYEIAHCMYLDDPEHYFLP